MATPQKKHGVRQTRKPIQKTHQPGRPKGTRKKRKFDETRLGFMLKYETPLEYSLILAGTKKAIFIQPDWHLIESICGASGDISFSKAKFKTYLDEYKEYGIYCNRPKKITPERLTYYNKLKLNKVKSFTKGQKVNLKAIFKSIR